MSNTDFFVETLKSLGFKAVYDINLEVFWRIEVKDVEEFVNHVWYSSRNSTIRIRSVIPSAINWDIGKPDFYTVLYYQF